MKEHWVENIKVGDTLYEREHGTKKVLRTLLVRQLSDEWEFIEDGDNYQIFLGSKGLQKLPKNKRFVGLSSVVCVVEGTSNKVSLRFMKLVNA